MGSYGHGDTGWFTHDRFGMFIHWGLYAMPARHEWIRNREKINDADYLKFFELFNPDRFDPRRWAKAAAAAGMKYFVFTTKHHEGFCMWDTQYTDYKITNTPYGRDILAEVVEAFRAEGLKVGFYHSLLDWHHPHFTVDFLHPLGIDKTPEEIAELNRGRDMAVYREYLFNQTRELLTNYGKIDIFWYDFSYNRTQNGVPGKGAADWGSEELIKLIRSLQPDIIVDNRLDLPGSGDIVTPEQWTPDECVIDESGRPAVWEGCQTFSGSWGYHRDETSWKSAKQCIDLLINHVSRSGNLLMNVGPTSRGEFDCRALERLNDYAKWMELHSRAIYGCGAAPAEFPEPRDCRYTWNPKTGRLYLHIMNWPFRHIFVRGLADRIRYAQFLHDGSEVLYSKGQDHMLSYCRNPEGMLCFELPVIKPPVEVPVIEIILK